MVVFKDSVLKNQYDTRNKSMHNKYIGQSYKYPLLKEIYYSFFAELFFNLSVH